MTVDSAPMSIAGHELRYRLAAGYMKSGDVILDAACGIGYGVRFAPLDVRWHGVDQVDVIDVRWRDRADWIVADLMGWRPDFRFDVAVSFETIEHVKDPETLIDTLCQARRLVACSVPLIPTVGTNEWHYHDFTPEDLPGLFAERGWDLHQYLYQPSELSGIYLFTKP